jgi:DNA-binding MarR family transcriptional regulator
MASRKKVQNTHIGRQLRELHGALIDIVTVMNRPQGDEMLIRAAGIRLDRALFPLLVGIERFGPVGVVELADGVGRDYTTVSRQVGRLEELGLVSRHAHPTDGRVRAAAITAAGKAMTDRVDAARERFFRATFSDWSPEEIDTFVSDVRRFADAMKRPVGKAS